MDLARTLIEILRLKTVRIRLGDTPEAERIRREYRRPHPRYLIIPNKTLGVELVELAEFPGREAYLESVNGKNSAAYFSRKAAKKGYTTRLFDPNGNPESVFRVNMSKPCRQGHEMSEGYRTRQDSFLCDERHPYFGVFAPDGTLAAYASVFELGELALINRILGHGDHLDDGVMYLLGTSLIGQYAESRRVSYVMYDMYFGASDGLKLFKRRLGFKPYRAIWK